MKPILFALAILALAPLLPASEVPPLTAGQAVAAAQTDLETRGLQDTVFIAMVSYKKASLLGGEPAHWEVLWSKEFDAQTEGRKEIGLKVKMDGSYSRSVR